MGSAKGLISFDSKKEDDGYFFIKGPRPPWCYPSPTFFLLFWQPMPFTHLRRGSYTLLKCSSC